MPSRLGHGLYKKIVALKNIFRCIIIVKLLAVLCDITLSLCRYNRRAIFNNARLLWRCVTMVFKAEKLQPDSGVRVYSSAHIVEQLSYIKSPDLLLILQAILILMISHTLSCSARSSMQ